MLILTVDVGDFFKQGNENIILYICMKALSHDIHSFQACMLARLQYSYSWNHVGGV